MTVIGGALQPCLLCLIRQLFQIDVNDVTYSSSGGRAPVPLGTAEDCYGHGTRKSDGARAAAA